MTDVTPGTVPDFTNGASYYFEEDEDQKKVVEAFEKGEKFLTKKPDVVKQIIVLRTDLAMPPGKSASQAAHASIRFLTERVKPLVDRTGLTSFGIPQFSSAERLWITGQFTKIVCRVSSSNELLLLRDKAREAGLVAHDIIDSGHTVFDGVPTLTALAIGPDYSTKLDPVTGHLELY